MRGVIGEGQVIDLTKEQAATGAALGIDGVTPLEPKLVAKNKTFQVVITGVATVEIQVSNDNGTTWVTQSSHTTSSGYTSDAPWQRYRANVTAFTSGTVSVYVGT